MHFQWPAQIETQPGTVGKTVHISILAYPLEIALSDDDHNSSSDHSITSFLSNRKQLFDIITIPFAIHYPGLGPPEKGNWGYRVCIKFILWRDTGGRFLNGTVKKAQNPHHTKTSWFSLSMPSTQFMCGRVEENEKQEGWRTMMRVWTQQPESGRTCITHYIICFDKSVWRSAALFEATYFLKSLCGLLIV